MKTQKTFSQKDLDTQVDFFKLLQPDAPSLTTWIFVSCAALLLTLSGMWYLHSRKTHHLALLNSNHSKLTDLNEDLKDKMHSFQLLEDSNKELNEKLEALKKLKEPAKKVIPYLMKTISVSIRKQTWLTRINVAQQDGTSSFKLTGNTLDESGIVPFTRELMRVDFITQLRLVHVKRVDPDELLTQEAKQTEFTVAGDLLSGELTSTPLNPEGFTL